MTFSYRIQQEENVMNFRNIVKAAIASAVMLVPISSAYAYSIHVVDGVYTIECANGVKSTGSTLQVSHAQAAYFCKVRGSSITVPGGKSPKPDSMKKAPAVLKTN